MYLLKSGPLRLSCLDESCKSHREGLEKFNPCHCLLPKREHNFFLKVTVSLAQLRVNSCKLKAATVWPCQYIFKEFLIHKLLTLLSIIACLLWQHLLRECQKCKQQPIAFCSEVLPVQHWALSCTFIPSQQDPFCLYMSKDCTIKSYIKQNIFRG